MKKYLSLLFVFLFSGCSTISTLPLPKFDFFSSGQEVRLINEKDEKVALRYFLAPPYGDIEAFYLRFLGIQDSFITTKFEADNALPEYFWAEVTYTLGEYTASTPKNGKQYDFYFKGIERAQRFAHQMVLSEQEANRFKASFQGKKVILVSIEEETEMACKRQSTYDDKAYCIALDEKGKKRGEYNYLTTYYDLHKKTYQKETKYKNNKIPEARCYQWEDDFFHCKKLRKMHLLVGTPKRLGQVF